MPSNDSWDWPFILYAGMVWLNMPEENIWQVTPRKFFALLTVHYDVKRVENTSSKNRNLKNWRSIKGNKPGTRYIDEIKW